MTIDCTITAPSANPFCASVHDEKERLLEKISDITMEWLDHDIVTDYEGPLPILRKCRAILEKEEFVDILNIFKETFPKLKPEVNNCYIQGFVQKKTVAAGSKIFVHGDYHGDLLTLLANLHSMRQLSFTNSSFQLDDHCYAIFLGDYVDRGADSMKVLYLLMLFKLLNPDKVFLLRGNHEDISQNKLYMDEHDDLLELLFQKCGCLCRRRMFFELQEFYESLPLALYLGVQENNRTDYTQFSHGLFNLTFDPLSFFQSADDRALVRYLKTMPQNFTYLATQPDLSLEMRANIDTIFDVFSKVIKKMSPFQSTFQYGDYKEVAEPEGFWQKRRGMQMNEKFIQSYFQLSSDKDNTLSCLVHGHQHEYILSPQKTVHTLPAGFFYTGKKDLSYLITTAANVINWRFKHVKIALDIQNGTTFFKGPKLIPK